MRRKRLLQMAAREHGTPLFRTSATPTTPLTIDQQRLRPGFLTLRNECPNSRMTAPTVVFIDTFQGDPNGDVGRAIPWRPPDWKPHLMGSQDHRSIGNGLTGPVLNEVLKPETVDRRFVRGSSLVKPSSALLDLSSLHLRASGVE